MALQDRLPRVARASVCVLRNRTRMLQSKFPKRYSLPALVGRKFHHVTHRLLRHQ
jgi:hypothetical protein